MDKSFFDNIIGLLKDGTLYQFMLLMAVIVFQIIFMVFNNGQPNEMILGGILTIMVGVPVISSNRKDKL